MQESSSGYPFADRISTTEAGACPVAPDFTDRAAARTEWAALALLLAGRASARLSTNDGKDYLTRNVRRIQQALPRYPAAVHLYNRKGQARVLALDFDTARGDANADYASATKMLTQHYVDFISDTSPSGGYHIYIPLDFHSERRYQPELYLLAQRFRKLFPTIDPQPHANASTGCIRTPGSPWKKQGFQRLLTDLKESVYIATTGNDTGHLEALFAALPHIPTESVNTEELPEDFSAETTAWIPQNARYLAPRLNNIARTGLYDASRYASHSEARMAVLTGCARAGLSTDAVRQRIETGTWPGLAALYGADAKDRYRRLFTYEYTKAQKLIKDTKASSERSVHRVTTSPKKVTGGAAPHVHLRSLEAHLSLTEAHRYPGSVGYKKRLLLRALIAAGHQTAALTLSLGIRSLALGSGVHHTQIPQLLHELCTEPEPLVRKVAAAKGRNATTYALIVPTTNRPTPWRRRIPVHALRPAFLELGLTSALVYESIELHSFTSVRALARATGLHPSGVQEALQELLAFDLITKHPTRVGAHWETTGSEKLTRVAEELGCLEVFQHRIEYYRRERRDWWAWLDARRDLKITSGEYMPHDDPNWQWPLHPPPEAA